MGLVQVILSEDVHALGNAGEIVSVKPGYARNYLIPCGAATRETLNQTTLFMSSLEHLGD